MFPNRVGRPACFKPSASRSIQQNHSLQQPTLIILRTTTLRLWQSYDLEKHRSLLVSQSHTRPNQVSFSSFGLFFLHFGINFVLAHRALWLRDYERFTSGYRNPKWLASSESGRSFKQQIAKTKRPCLLQRAAYMAYIQLKNGTCFWNGLLMTFVYDFRYLGDSPCSSMFHQAQRCGGLALQWLHWAKQQRSGKDVNLARSSLK